MRDPEGEALGGEIVEALPGGIGGWVGERRDATLVISHTGACIMGKGLLPNDEFVFFVRAERVVRKRGNTRPP